MQLEEIEKIHTSRVSVFENIANLEYDKYGVSNQKVETPYVYLSQETGCSDYGTGTYRILNEINIYVRVIKLDTISPAFVSKHNLYDNLTRTLSSYRFPTAIDYSPLLIEMIEHRQRYQYKSCYMPSSDTVNVILKHKDLSRVERRNMETMYDGLPATITKDFSIISEKDYADIRIFFLLITDV